MTINILLGTSFIDRYIQGIFPGEQQAVPWQSDPVFIPTKPATKVRRSLSSAEPSRSRIQQDNVVVRKASQVIIDPSTETQVIVSLPIIELSELEPVQLGNQYQHLHVAPEILEPVRSQTFYILVSNFHPKRVYLPKDMVVTYCTEPPLLIIYLPQQTQDQEPAT